MIIDETLRTSTLVDVEMNHRQEVEIFHDCYAYEENQGQYLEPVQYLPVKNEKNIRERVKLSLMYPNLRVCKIISPVPKILQRLSWRKRI